MNISTLKILIFSLVFMIKCGILGVLENPV